MVSPGEFARMASARASLLKAAEIIRGAVRELEGIDACDALREGPYDQAIELGDAAEILAIEIGHRRDRLWVEQHAEVAA